MGLTQLRFLATRRFVGLLALSAVLGLTLVASQNESGAESASAGIVIPCITYPEILAPPAQPPAANAPKGKRPVIFVGNNWDGTADVVTTNGRKFRNVARLNIVPDYRERILEVCTNPVDLIYFLAIRELVGEGNDQLVDDMFSTPDGRLLVVSRPSFKDVIGLRIAGPKTGEVKWRFEVDGQRSDHMAVSPDGRQVAVSASTGNVVHLLNTKTGEEEGRFASGDSPHENTYSENGRKIYHASIGLVYTPGDGAVFDTDTTKGDRFFQVVRVKDQKILSQVDMGSKLEAAGYPDMSAAVRPMAITSNERKAFLQVSFFHGVVTYDLVRQEVSRITGLPNLVPNLPRELYLLDSAHHGIALSGNDRRLCIAGTMSDYATIVSRKRLRSKPTLSPRLLQEGTKPYWSTTSANGKHCYVSWSGTDDISVFSYRKRREIAHIQVGDHPQRIRNGFARRSFVQANR